GEAAAPLREELVPVCRQAVARSAQDVDGASPVRRTDTLLRNPNRQLGQTAAAKAPAGRGPAEEVAGLRGILHPWSVLAPELVAVGPQAVGGAVDHVDGSGLAHAPDRLVIGANRKVRLPAMAEVGGGERGTEEVRCLGCVLDP